MIKSGDRTQVLRSIRSLFKSTELLGIEHPINAYVLPRTDPHQSEFLSSHHLRVQHLSNFSGSSAFVVVNEDKALIWTDGRYFIQAANELSLDIWTIMKDRLPESIKFTDWIIQNMDSGSRIGFDPSLFGLTEGKKFVDSLKRCGLLPTPITKHNLIDLVWENRPPEPNGKVLFMSLEESGEDSQSKIEKLRAVIQKLKCDAILLSKLDEIAWLFNIRGSDLPFTPVVFSYAFITLNESFLFIDESKLTPDVIKHLKAANTVIMPYETIDEFIQKYHSDMKTKSPNFKVLLPKTCNYKILTLFDQLNVHVASSPVEMMKAVKNPIELAGMRNAHVRDSAALIQFLCWLKNHLKSGAIIDEKSAERQLDFFRSKTQGFISLSFHTISSADKNTAIIHYNAPEENSALIKPDSVYLLDSGGQYRDGTTDVTRTLFHADNPPEYVKKMNTLVLIGHINLACQVFPTGLTGKSLDSITRLPLWNAGKDFIHGAGHGVGHFLCVHEGLFMSRVDRKETIEKGNVITIEPGYYETDNFGIRIENCYEVIDAEGLPDFLTFKPLTLVPVQKDLIIRDMLSTEHIQWLNNYHNKCLEVVGKYLQEQGLQDEYNFLAECCTPF